MRIRKLEMLRGQLRELRELVGETADWRSAATLVGAVAWGRLAPGRLREALAVEPTVAFRDFRLKFRAGQGELTPFFQIRGEFTQDWVPNRRVRLNWTVVDAGANVGLFSLLLGRVKQVIAIEPNPAAHARLVANLRLNGIAATTHRVALSNRVGMLRFEVPTGSTVLARVASEGGVEVQCTTIDKLLDDADVERVHLLKLDLEGHEIPALEGARRALETGCVERIYAEFNDRASLDRLDQHLGQFGYRRRYTSDFNAVFFAPQLESEPPAP